MEYSASIERYAIEQPDDADVPAALARIRRWRDGYLRCAATRSASVCVCFIVP